MARDAEMRDAFRAFDQNGDGVISVSEMRQAMLKMGQKLSDAELEAIIRDVDKDGDGFVNYEGMYVGCVGGWVGCKWGVDVRVGVQVWGRGWGWGFGGGGWGGGVGLGVCGGRG